MVSNGTVLMWPQYHNLQLILVVRLLYIVANVIIVAFRRDGLIIIGDG